MSKSFRQHLETLPLAEQRAIRAAERKYLQSRRVENNPNGGAGDPLVQAFEESMAGYVETPAGHRSADDTLGLDLPFNL